MRTITLDDTTAAALLAALQAGTTTTGTSAPSPTPTPTPVPSKPIISYPVSKLTTEDKYYLWGIEIRNMYKIALKSLPGSHQVFFDVLTDNMGNHWSDATPQPPGTVNSPILKNQISNAIAVGATYPTNWSFANYSGPLKQIVADLIKAKLGQ